ncbi:MAG: methyltransferase domain-containing protein [Anaerolineae bacterium]
MSPWYEESFGLPYLQLYAHRDAEEAAKNAQRIMELLNPRKDEPFLDLGCGAGRYLQVFRKLGLTRLVGLDLSEALLKVAAEKLATPEQRETPQEDIQLVRADMRAIPYRNYFAAVASLFTSFGYFGEDEENAAVFREVYRVLKPGGKFLIDYLNRYHVLRHLVPCDEDRFCAGYVRNVRYLSQNGRRVEKDTLFVNLEGKENVFHESVRAYRPSEIVVMLKDAGFVNIHRYGSLAGEEFSPDSPRLVITAQKEEAR